jgi:endonuclease YncB( thermonuclease family)
MNKYRVHIEQVNETYYDVYAPNKENARGQARALWKQDNEPEVTEVERLNK